MMRVNVGGEMKSLALNTYMACYRLLKLQRLTGLLKGEMAGKLVSCERLIMMLILLVHYIENDSIGNFISARY